MSVDIKISTIHITCFGKLDFDGDIITKLPLIDCSERIIENNNTMYITKIYDLLTYCKEVKIEKQTHIKNEKK
jgi:hypothetical protein